MIPVTALFALCALICLSAAFGWVFNNLCAEILEDALEAKLGASARHKDDLLLIENERLRQMLEMAADDVYLLDGSDPAEYLHDLATRDYYSDYTMVEDNDD